MRNEMDKNYTPYYLKDVASVTIPVDGPLAVDVDVIEEDYVFDSVFRKLYVAAKDSAGRYYTPKELADSFASGLLRVDYRLQTENRSLGTMAITDTQPVGCNSFEALLYSRDIYTPMYDFDNPAEPIHVQHELTIHVMDKEQFEKLKEEYDL